MTEDYTCSNDEIEANNSLVIEGNSHSLSLNSTTFKINSNDTSIFKNIHFKTFYNVSINTSSNLTFINCSFDNSDMPNCANASSYMDNIGMFTGEVSPDIVSLAKEIVGNSKDLAAAKKLAKWVGINIQHEKNAGFYQSPSETVERRLGNCCCQTDLFLQMCYAIGITENHYVGYVHVGNLKFGERHFFAIIDNICIDPDVKTNNPWGHCSTVRPVFIITEYPCLSIMREY